MSISRGFNFAFFGGGEGGSQEALWPKYFPVMKYDKGFLKTDPGLLCLCNRRQEKHPVFSLKINN